VAIILESVRAGQSVAMAAVRAGTDDSTVSKWKARGIKEGEGPYFTFFNDLQRAEADCQLALLLTVKAASRVSWQAAAWMLERKWYKEFGRPAFGVGIVPPSDTPGAGTAAVLEIHLPAKEALPDAVQIEGPSGEAEEIPPGPVRAVDAGDARVRQPTRPARKAAPGARRPPRGKGRR
jgi:hypothetical protein